jgi:uncharacterized tellurite resistance protein B-like protein
MSSTSPHPAHDLPEAARIEYLTVVASFVLADHEADALELGQIGEMCRTLGLSDAAKDQVLAAAKAPDASAVDAMLARLKKDIPLRVALLTDAIVIAFADGKVAPTESRDIARLADAIEIETGQVALLGRYVESVILDRDEKQLSRELGKGVAAQHPGHVIRWLHKLFRR